MGLTHPPLTCPLRISQAAWEGGFPGRERSDRREEAVVPPGGAQSTRRTVAVAILLTFAGGPIGLTAAKPTTRIAHAPLKRFVPGFRIALQATITDAVAVTHARCYFRASPSLCLRA